MDYRLKVDRVVKMKYWLEVSGRSRLDRETSQPCAVLAWRCCVCLCPLLAAAAEHAQ